MSIIGFSAMAIMAAISALCMCILTGLDSNFNKNSLTRGRATCAKAHYKSFMKSAPRYVTESMEADHM